MSSAPADLDALRRLCGDLPDGSGTAAAAAAARQTELTKPPGSLGRLEQLVIWLATWQGRPLPQVKEVEILVFAGNHGIVAQGVSPYPADVTAQMVANFAAGGAAINQLAGVASAGLRVFPLAGLRATADATAEPAMTVAEMIAAVATGFTAVDPGLDLLCLGEMGIGNTTSAALLGASLFGGHGVDWAGRGTGVDDAGLMRKIAVVDRALAEHGEAVRDPVEAMRRVGGFELAAIFGAVLAARHHRVPVLLDGFACTAAAAVLDRLHPGGLDHAQVAHRSAEAGHRHLLAAINKTPVLDLQLRLGEGTGAALAVPILRAACACHDGMATFSQAGVSDRT